MLPKDSNTNTTVHISSAVEEWFFFLENMGKYSGLKKKKSHQQLQSASYYN